MCRVAHQLLWAWWHVLMVEEKEEEDGRLRLRLQRSSEYEPYLSTQCCDSI
jgi:hypothetical protein